MPLIILVIPCHPVPAQYVTPKRAPTQFRVEQGVAHMNDRDIQGRRAGSEPPRLLDLAREAIRRHHYSYRTEETYLQWMKRFILCSGKRQHTRERAGERKGARV